MGNIINNNHSNDRNDWRFRGQDEYLMNVKLKHRNFDVSVGDHDHCDFCWEKFSRLEGDLHKGYCTLDKYYWICDNCFNDFHCMFNWIVIK